MTLLELVGNTPLVEINRLNPNKNVKIFGKLEGNNFKPSHEVKIEECYTLSIGTLKKIIKVKDIIDKRGSFEIAKNYYIDCSPVIDKDTKLQSMFFETNIKRSKGAGRPTKKDRRSLDNFSE